LINHSPKFRTDAPNHEDMNTPTKKMNAMEVKKPKPNMLIPSSAYIGEKNPSTK
jgi:hypothetical protein